MTTAPEDLAFDRFQRTRAPEALAEVFDRTAGRLLLVALHLSRDAAGAEDLVQETFVVALRSAARFEAGRRVLPWLLGILGNVARAARRRAAQAVAMPATLGPEHPGQDDATPVDALLTAEARAAVAAALTALPEAYRQVLDLRFVHGLRSVQIARSLGRSPETVRTQVRRGLEHVRRLLPKGLAVPVALLAVRGRGLAAVRGAVLAQGRGATSIATPAVSLAWVCVLLVALGAATMTLWPGAGGAFTAGAPVVASVAPTAPSAATPSAEVLAGAPTGRSAQREAVPASQAAAVPSAPGAGTLPCRVRGRCVAVADDAPLAGVRVCLSDRPGPLTAEAVSDAAGGFGLDWPAAGPGAARLWFEHPGYVRLACTLVRPAPGTVLDLGDVRMPRGVRIRGVVADGAGQPVAGANVDLQHTALSPVGLRVGNQPGIEARRQAETDAAGQFVSDAALESGTWLVQVQDRTVVSPARFEAQAAGEQELRIVVVTQDFTRAIRGRCVDEAGAPYPRASEWVEPASGGRRSSLRSAGPDGSFILPFEPGLPESPVLGFEHRDASPERGRRSDVAWGRRDVVLTLKRKAKVAEPTAAVLVEVTDARGAPVEQFALRCCTDPRQSARFSAELGALRQPGHHPGGRVEVTASTRWRNVLFVEPDDVRLVPAGPVFFAGDQGAVQVVVRDQGQVRVCVQTAAGVPIAGSTVELLRPWTPEAVTAQSGKVPLRDPFGVLQLEPWTVRISEAVTGADGTATLLAPAGETDLVLRSLGPVHRPFVRADVAEGEVPVVVTAAIGGALAGCVLGWDAVRDRFPEPTLILCRPGSAPFVYFARLVPTWSPDPDGRYRIAGIEPGAWDVHVFSGVNASAQQLAAGGLVRKRLEPALASVVLAEGQRLELDLDARSLVPGRIVATMLLDGQPLRHTRLLADTDGPQHQPQQRGTTDNEGRCTIDPALPGQHWIAINGPAVAGSPTIVYAREPIVVAAGTTVTVTVELHSADAEDFVTALRRHR